MTLLLRALVVRGPLAYHPGVRAAILAVGSELLGTVRLDTNSLRLTEVLDERGVELVYKSVLGDRLSDLAPALKLAIESVDLVLVTGGLGPTADDLTREALATATGTELHERDEIVEEIRRRFASFGREMPEINRRQALVPTGGVPLDNPVGSAPGLRLEAEGGATVFLFPGVPRELAVMIDRHFAPWLHERTSAGGTFRSTLRVACVAESTVEERLAPVYEAFGELAILARPGDVEVRLEAAAAGELAAFEQAAREALGDAVYGSGEAGLETVVLDALRERKWSMATAESCTGGWIAQRLTSVPGSSDAFVGGVVAYDNAVKTRTLGVRETTLALHGAVSTEVAEEMASGALAALGADVAVAVSGIAGPGGGTRDKPVGTVCVALAAPAESHSGIALLSRRLQLPGDREVVRALATQWSLDLVRRWVLGLEASPVGVTTD